MANSGDNAHGIKHDDGKLRMGLIPPEAIARLAAVYTFGANKYAPHNWERGIQYSRVYDAVQRHLNAWHQGQDLDDESGLPHLAHAAFGLFALLTFDARGQGKQLDDMERGGLNA